MMLCPISTPSGSIPSSSTDSTRRLILLKAVVNGNVQADKLSGLLMVVKTLLLLCDCMQ